MSYTLIHGDCLTELEKIESASVDAIFADPPYPYIKRSYGYWTEETWMPMMQEVVRQSRRILKPHGSAVFVLQPNSEKVGKMRLWLWKFMVWAGEYWGIVQDAYWWNTGTIPDAHSNQGKLMRTSIKYCLWLGELDCYRNQDSILWGESEENARRRLTARAGRVKGKYQSYDHKKITQVAKLRGGVTPYNVLPMGTDYAQRSASHFGHGAGTPLKLADWWLRYISKPGDTVLDMFSGTGTTGVAARRLGRNYIGIERIEDYHKTAHYRIGEVAKELTRQDLPMFAGAL